MKLQIKPDYLPDRFQRIHIELTNKCNFSCTFCPDAIMNRNRGFMEKETAFKILDEIAAFDFTNKITFHVMGEPLLHPDFFEIADHAVDLGLPIGLTTNGALLGPKFIEKLTTRPIHQIDISLQTPDAESFAVTRGTKIDFDKYTSGLLELLKKTRQSSTPPIFKIRIMTTKFASKMRKQLGIPNFLPGSRELRDLIRTWTHEVHEVLGLRTNHGKLKRELSRIHIFGWNVVEIAPRVFIETYVLTDWGNSFSSEKIIPAKHGFCFGMQDHFAILYSGDVVLCCIDYEGKTSLGNVNERSLADIFNSRETELIVKGLQKGKLLHEHCRSCLGSSNNLSSWTKPALSYLGLKVLKPFFYRSYKVF